MGWQEGQSQKAGAPVGRAFALCPANPGSTPMSLLAVISECRVSAELCWVWPKDKTKKKKKKRNSLREGLLWAERAEIPGDD